MRDGGGKAKGSSYEREVCVLLSKWISSNQREDIFWRSATSGGRATVAHKKGVKLASQVGDISCIDPIGSHFMSAFAIECKFYANLDYHGLITGKGKLLSFWAEINEQAGRYNKLPILFARQNRLPSTVCLTSCGAAALGLHERKTDLISRVHDIHIILAEKFLAQCPPYI